MRQNIEIIRTSAPGKFENGKTNNVRTRETEVADVRD